MCASYDLFLKFISLTFDKYVPDTRLYCNPPILPSPLPWIAIENLDRLNVMGNSCHDPDYIVIIIFEIGQVLTEIY